MAKIGKVQSAKLRQVHLKTEISSYETILFVNEGQKALNLNDYFEY